MNELAIDKLVIVGGGTAGWMSAALLSKLFDGKLQIELIESDAIGTVGVGEATIPPIQVYNDLADVDEATFLRDTKATIKLAIEFQNWGAIGDAYLHGFGYIGRKVGAVSFQHVYLKGLAEGVAGPLSDYSLNNTAAYANRFNRLDRIEGTPLSGITYAYHFDASLYARYLRGLSEQRGVMRKEGRIEEVLVDGESGDVTGMRMEDGSIVEGDFFIDCSGFRSLVFDKTLGVGFDDLRQRELQRRNRRLAMVSTASVAGMLFAIGLATAAILARNEAERQAETARRTASFMASDWMRGTI